MENRDKPAYPVHPEVTPNFSEHEYSGISKREMIAAMALQGLLAHFGEPSNPMTVANMATDCADALLTQLEKQ